MRKVKVLLVALVASLFFSATAFAATEGMSPESSLRAEIIDLIDQPDVSVLNGKTEIANLRLMVNNDSELIVIDTGTSNKKLDVYLKAKLNYQKIDASQIQHLNFYFVKVEFRSK